MSLLDKLNDRNIRYEVVGNKLLINHSCSEVLPLLNSKVIDLILTDPPYDRNDVDLTPLTGVQKSELSKQFKRILKNTGNLALMAGKLCKWRWHNHLTETGFELHSEVIWIYPNPPQMIIPYENRRQFMWCHDTIMCFRLTNKNYFKVTNPRDSWTWIKCNVSTGLFREMPRVNSTPRPKEIAKKFINHMLPEDGILLDPFMGTGTFPAYTNCTSIGVEQNPDVFRVAVDRITKLHSQKDLGWW